MKAALIATGLALATPATAQQIGPLAIAECRDQTRNQSACLPFAQVAIDMLAAVEHPDYLDTAGAALSLRCARHHPGRVGRWDCVRRDLDETRRLLAMLEDPAEIADPVLRAIADPEILAALADLEAEAVARAYGSTD